MGDFGGGYTGSMDNTEYGWNEQAGHRGYTHVGDQRGQERSGGGDRERSQDGIRGYYNIGGDRGAMEYGGNTGFGYTRAGQTYDSPTPLRYTGRSDYRDRQAVSDYHDAGSRGYADGGLDSPSPEAHRGRGGGGPAERSQDEYGNPIGHFRDPRDSRFENQQGQGGVEQRERESGKKKGGIVEKAMRVVDDLI